MYNTFYGKKNEKLVLQSFETICFKRNYELSSATKKDYNLMECCYQTYFISFLTVMETEKVQVPAKKKEPSKRTAAQKKAVTVETSDSEDEIIIDDDEAFEIAAPEAGKKGGRKAAGNTKAAKPAAETKKRGPAKKQQPEASLGQRLLTEMLKPAESSPEKKVRKMRASPFNKKSGSKLGRAGTIEEPSGSSPSTSEEVAEVLPPKARPQRANRRQARYVLSDSESEKAIDDSEFDEDEDED